MATCANLRPGRASTKEKGSRRLWSCRSLIVEESRTPRRRHQPRREEDEGTRSEQKGRLFLHWAGYTQIQRDISSRASRALDYNRRLASFIPDEDRFQEIPPRHLHQSIYLSMSQYCLYGTSLSKQKNYKRGEKWRGEKVKATKASCVVMHADRSRPLCDLLLPLCLNHTLLHSEDGRTRRGAGGRKVQGKAGRRRRGSGGSSGLQLPPPLFT